MARVCIKLNPEIETEGLSPSALHAVECSVARIVETLEAQWYEAVRLALMNHPDVAVELGNSDEDDGEGWKKGSGNE